MAHRYIIGQPNSGKSELAKQWTINAIHNGDAVCYFDPYGHDIDDLIQYIPKHRRKDVVIFDPTQFAIPLNPLETKKIALMAGVFASSIKIAAGYGGTSTPRMDGVLYNALYAVMEARHGLFGLYLILSSSKYRKAIVGAIGDPVVKRYWEWFDALNDKQQLEQSDSTLNKVQTLMADPRIRAICGAVSRFSIEDMVQNKILFIRLPQGELGVEKSKLIGSILVSQVHQACLQRDTTVPLHLIIDGCETFADEPQIQLLASAHKYDVHLTLINQYRDQLSREHIASVKANCITYAFALSYEDSQYYPTLGDQEVQPYELAPFQCWVFGPGRPQLLVTKPIDRLPYQTSERTIRAHLTRNLVKPATREIEELLKKY